MGTGQWYAVVCVKWSVGTMSRINKPGRSHPDRYQREPKVDVEVAKDYGVEISGELPRPIWG